MRIFLLSFFLISGELVAKPWLSNRYAQNCAGCHAPGRKNVEAPKRRCTLSCQGCHVNPNGGGIRNLYGKWNQDKWLRSFIFAGKDHSVQPYAEQGASKKPYEKAPPEFRKKAAETGFKMELTDELMDEKDFDREHGAFETHVSKDEVEMMYQIPREDPYRDRVIPRLDMSGEMRYLSFSKLSEESKSGQEVGPDYFHFLMNLDLGLRWRPAPRHINLVYESTFRGAPQTPITYGGTFSNAATRSMYLLVDDLPYNTYAMTGYYMPAIGLATDDHTDLSRQMISQVLYGHSRPQNMIFRAFSVGGSPNVPYANLHYISKKANIGSAIKGDETDGFVLSVGGRFVTLGLSVNYDYLRLKDDNPVTQIPLTQEIYSLTGGMHYKRYTVNLNATSFAVDRGENGFDEGGVITLLQKMRLWRENYFSVKSAYSNTTEKLKKGHALQHGIGFDSYWLNGLRTELTYNVMETSADERKVATFLAQLHIYL